MNPTLPLRGDSDHSTQVLDLLEKAGDISASARQVICRYMATWSCDALEALTETHLLTEEALATRLAEVFQVSLTKDLTKLSIVPESLGVLPFEKARAWQMIMVLHPEGERLLLVSNPACSERVHQIQNALPFGFTLSVGERSDIVRAIDELYPLAAQLPSLHGE